MSNVLSEEKKQQVIALGTLGWTLRLLADKLIELEIVDTVSTETVRRTLKKTNSSRG